MLNVALARAREGFKVFPVFADGERAKRPWRKGWQAFATSDVHELLDKWPAGNWGVGIATGYGLFVLDVDAKDGGLETIKTLDLPETYTVRTARGGLHFYYSTPPGIFIGNSVRTLGAGLDVRGVGGLVVAAGSKINGVAYERIN